jgi:2-polyprenyl-3-methyl-5-hydroxy-6-metoxy-1,4-benzoquinol methylase
MKKYDISDDGILSFIEPYVTGKTVLDVGCVEHDLKNIHKQRIWVHDYLRSVAKEVIGIDYLPKAVKELNRHGYKIYCQNAENIKLNKKFDVVFAGEIIEHVNNQGLFLDSLKRVVKENGVIIITTPNVFSLQRIIPVLYKLTNNPNVNPEHVLFHTPATLSSLLTRNNLNIENISYAHYPAKNKNLKRLIVSLLSSVIGSQFMENLIFVTKKKKNK